MSEYQCLEILTLELDILFLLNRTGQTAGTVIAKHILMNKPKTLKLKNRRRGNGENETKTKKEPLF